MGIVSISLDDDFESEAVEYIPPVEDGLLYWGFPNGSLANFSKNFAPDGAQVAVVGSPVVDNKGAIVDGSNYINTGLTQGRAFTWIVVGHPVTDGAEVGMFMSNYSGGRPNGLGGVSFGASLYCGFNDENPGVFEVRASVARFTGVSGSGSGLNYVSLPSLDITKPAFLAMTFDESDKIVKAYNLATGASGERPPIADQVDRAVTPIYIGATPNTTWVNNPRRIYFAAMYNRRLSPEELQLIYQCVKPYLATHGVVVGPL